MKRLMLLVFVVALVAPVAAFADAAPTPASTANQLCKQAQTSLGATLFAQTYRTFGKCVSSKTPAAQQDVTNAAKTCKAQQADPNFAGSHGGKTFDQFYGTAKGKSADANAYGKCVSAAVKASVDAQTAATTHAAKVCKAALKASPANFATAWGTGSNAFGKCVAKTAKTP
jgi:hypothetical protein